MSERKSSGKAYTPNMSAPGKAKKGSRALMGAVLALLLPPVGIIFLWRRGVFRTRGRMLLTGLGTLIMTIWFVALSPADTVLTQMPVPVKSVAVTVAPDDGVVLALSNLDALLAQRQLERDAAAGITPEPMTTDDPAYLAEQEALLYTPVYAVWGVNARYYHKDTVCGTQSNRRQMTLQEAMYNGMAACPDCHPPVYVGPLHSNANAAAAAANAAPYVEATPTPPVQQPDLSNIFG